MSLSEDLYEGSVFGYRYFHSKISENKGYQIAKTDGDYMWKTWVFIEKWFRNTHHMASLYCKTESQTVSVTFL